MQLDERARRDKLEKLGGFKKDPEDSDNKLAMLDGSAADLSEELEEPEEKPTKNEGDKKKGVTKTIRDRHSRNAAIGGQRSEQDTVKIEIEKLHKKELVPLTKSQIKELKSHQVPTSRHLSQSMKNTDSIKRALETQRKADELKSTRLHAID